MSDFPPGFEVVILSQTYEPIDVVEVVGADGVPTRAIQWATHCAGCQTNLVVTTPMKIARPERLCEACHARSNRAWDPAKQAWRMRQRNTA